MRLARSSSRYEVASLAGRRRLFRGEIWAHTQEPDRVSPSPGGIAGAFTTGDPLTLMRLFGITEATAMRYVGTAYLERTAKLPR